MVENYLENRNIVKAQGELVKIIDTFTNESIRYFTDILDTKVFTHIFFSICRILNREKKGFSEDSISEELQKPTPVIFQRLPATVPLAGYTFLESLDSVQK